MKSICIRIPILLIFIISQKRKRANMQFLILLRKHRYLTPRFQLSIGTVYIYAKFLPFNKPFYFPSPSICSKHRLQAKHESLQKIHTVELPIQIPSHTFRQHVQVRLVQWAQFVVALQQLRQHSLHPFGSLRSIFCATGA